MALGGGTFLTQNKILPGAYINFVSVSRADAALSDRGTCAVPMELNWGADGEVFKVENGDFEKESLSIFGYSYESDELLKIREVFKNAKTLYIYRLNSGVKASNSYAEAVCSGTRGNDLKIVIAVNVDDESKFDVLTYLGDIKVDTQTVAAATELKANDFVSFKADAALEASAGVPLKGGTNLTEITGEQYQAALDKLEAYGFNTLGCVSANQVIKALFAAFTKRMRDEAGAKFQTVLCDYDGDYEGLINIRNTVEGENTTGTELVYWVTGAQAGCAVNKSVTNKLYDGEYIINADYKQSELEAAIKKGQFMFHKVGSDIRVLEDINSFTSATVEKNSDFGLNQVIRILDQIGNDIAVLFNTKFLGKIQNNDSGRISFWNEIVTYNKELQVLNAIENFESSDVIVEKGNEKRSVVVTNAVMPVCCMEKLYMTVMVA